ncbi:MAG TPA: hypothetical protein VG694_01615 [Candidatus Paceibacterota bacterium]|jgi:hypothetical protein|nr:hypothetical protein [Candidatus Paceibacterota bacterium]
MERMETMTPDFSALSEEKKAKIEFIHNFDFSRIKARMNVDYPSTPKHINALEKELKRFLSLFVVEEDGEHFFTESADDLWHYFILHTKEYKEFCKKVYGRFLNHNPILPDETPLYLSAYNKTKELYTKYFGKPSVKLWGKNGVCCSGCSGRFDPIPLLN